MITDQLADGEYRRRDLMLSQELKDCVGISNQPIRTFLVIAMVFEIKCKCDSGHGAS